MSKRQLDKIHNWIETNGFTLKFSKKDTVDYDEKLITLNKNQKHLIYSALHECGHVINNRKSSIKDCKILEKGSKTNLFKYKKLQDEINAWEEGYKLAKELKIRINKEKYDSYASMNFNTYVKYL